MNAEAIGVRIALEAMGEFGMHVVFEGGMAAREKGAVGAMAEESKCLRKERNWIFAVLLLHDCLEWVFIPRADAQVITPEYQLKASYLGKIPNFVQWPETEGAKAKSVPEAIRLCVVGNHAFGALLAQEAGRATVAGRKMEVRWMHKELELKVAKSFL